MAWVFVTKKAEIMSLNKPIKEGNIWHTFGGVIVLPKGSIKKLIGRELKWSDGPVELKDSSV